MDIVVRNAVILQDGALRAVDIGITDGLIETIADRLDGDAATIDAGSCLVVPGFVETHIHLDKTCILDRCTIEGGTVAEAVRETSRAKRDFTYDDVYARGRKVIEQCIMQGTTRMRTHVELDPGIGLIGFEAVDALRRDYAWGLDLELCVFPQEGLTNNPGTEELLAEGLRRGARCIGAVPYVDTDPHGQIDRIFALAREFDVDIDMHLDLADTPAGMNIDYVCAKTAEYGWGGRVAVGHMTQMSLLPKSENAALAGRLADCGVAVTILPATDLYLMGRNHDHSVPRGVTSAEPLRGAGVTCSISTNNILNPFTPYGDGSMIRMANLYANVCHVAHPAGLAGCLDMITHGPARLLRLADYGIAPGRLADLVALDATSPDMAVAALAQPLWGLKRGRRSFTRSRPTLHAPSGAA
jgi:cytosine deaminase